MGAGCKVMGLFSFGSEPKSGGIGVKLLEIFFALAL